MNICIFKGNLSRDPELRFTPNGSPVAQIGLAVNRVWYDKENEKREEVSFFDCTAFGKTAESIGQYFKKGNSILLTCRAKQESWDDKQTGQKRYAVKFIVERFEFCGDTGTRDSAKQPAAKQERRPPAQQHDDASPPADDDSIPF